MNDFATEEIELCGVDMMSEDNEAIAEIIHESLRIKGIDVTSFAWSINVEYMPQENDDE